MTATMTLDTVRVLRGDRRVLDGVSLEVRAGEMLSIVGPNGAGKSTLLGVLAGDLAPASGTAVIGGRPASEWSAGDLARLRSVLLQDTAIDFPFSAREIVAMGCRRARVARGADIDAVVERSLADVDALHLIDQPVTRLSTGERSRVTLARVIAQDAATMMLDEPTAALDIAHQHLTLQVARTLAMRGRAVVCVLHDLNLAAGYSDRVALLDGGRLVALGTPDRVLVQQRLTEVFGHPVDILQHRGIPHVIPATLAPADPPAG